PGLREYVPVHSYDLNEDTEGVPRMNINDAKENFLMKELPEPLAAYIAALRRSGVKVGHASELLEAKAKLKDDEGKQVTMQSGGGAAELAVVLNQLTATADYFVPGLINVNTAAAVVSARRQLRVEQRRTPAWLFEQELLNAEQFKNIAHRLTARSYQYHFQVVGYGLPSGRYRVLEAIVDFGRSKPMITYLRDITRFGMPFKIEPAPTNA